MSAVQYSTSTVDHTPVLLHPAVALQMIGLLPLRELSLDSHAYRQHPSMPRPQYSHLDNDGVKGLVDSICSRMRTGVAAHSGGMVGVMVGFC